MRTSCGSLTALLAAGLLLVGSAAAPAQTNQHMGSTKAANGSLAASLQSTRLLLHLAYYDYRGHRIKAVDKIEQAIRALGCQPVPLGGKPRLEGQNVADELLGQAIQELKAVQAQLAGRNDTSALHAQLALHAAVLELQLALTVR